MVEVNLDISTHETSSAQALCIAICAKLENTLALQVIDPTRLPNCQHETTDKGIRSRLIVADMDDSKFNKVRALLCITYISEYFLCPLSSSKDKC